MKFITGKDRTQIPLFASSIDEAIDVDNEVRLIDLFVDSLQLKDFGFKFNFIENGRPAYHPSDLLKIYIYGYMNRIRSSRQLEHASADVGLIFTAFNLRRIFNILDKNTIKKYLKELDFLFLILRSYFKAFTKLIFTRKCQKNFQRKENLSRLNQLYLSQNQFEFELVEGFWTN